MNASKAGSATAGACSRVQRTMELEDACLCTADVESYPAFCGSFRWGNPLGPRDSLATHHEAVSGAKAPTLKQ